MGRTYTQTTRTAHKTQDTRHAHPARGTRSSRTSETARHRQHMTGTHTMHKSGNTHTRFPRPSFFPQLHLVLRRWSSTVTQDPSTNDMQTLRSGIHTHHDGRQHGRVPAVSPFENTGVRFDSSRAESCDTPRHISASRQPPDAGRRTPAANETVRQDRSVTEGHKILSQDASTPEIASRSCCKLCLHLLRAKMEHEK